MKMNVEKVLNDRIIDLKNIRIDALANPGRWMELNSIEKALKFNKDLRFQLFGIYKIGKNTSKN